ncbi:flotillin family protein [Microbacterium esteraromaticum]|uniref:Flotillin family protein n=1 Tax=Microbacterium esteraromaticum TaxID=57043 RepID=A0A939DUJ2_9MICO|nr:SPFH domain-containing protein [Microbacterium esteraromaticum]MBN8205186.1 flotillin family protein [Microbacterium esteraromaticum]MBN8415340.1 flotillin family protein [Microbacterium esteraromaticum]
MEIAGIVGILLIIGIAVVAAIVVLLIMLLFARSWIKVARADEALVISGRKQKVQRALINPDGSTSSELAESPVTVIVNGKSLVNPITQRHEIISLRSRQVSLNAEAQSLDSVTLNVDGVAIVKIGSDPLYVRRAAERFASQDKAIEQFTTEQLEGALRGIVATLSVVELMRERKKFSDQIASDVSHELAEQGLILDSFQIKGITDAVGYIQSLGAPEIQAKRQAAEISQTNADRAINQKHIANEEANLIEQTALDTNTANANAGIGRARAEAEQAEHLARAQAEQAVLQQQAENRQAQLDADVKRVADAQRYEAETRAQADLFTREKSAEAAAIEQIKQAEARTRIAEQQAEADRARAAGEAAAAEAKAAGDANALRAQAEAEAEARRLRSHAEAEAIRAEGEARAAAVEAEANAIASNQEAFLSQRVLDVLPAIMSEFAKGYSAIGNVSIIGGSGDDGASDVIGGDNAKAMRAVFDSVNAATGLDLAAIIQGQAVGRGIGSGMAQPAPADPTGQPAKQPAKQRTAASATAPATAENAEHTDAD